MPPKLALVSFWTLFLLVGFLSASIFGLMYIFKFIDIPLLFSSVLITNLFLWLFGPLILDFVHQILYQMQFFHRLSFKTLYPELDRFIEDVTSSHQIPFPKIGIIEDDNPTAYTYGSAAFNARIILSRGIFTYLDEGEREAVVAHELGHIVHRDFIIMTIANTILQILYEISQIFLRAKSGRKKEKADILYLFGLITYIFYWISFYILLFLSRVRERYADEFSARTTKNPNLLSRALIKVAYGIMAKEENPKSMRLLENTRSLGIMGFRTAKEVGLLAKVTNLDYQKIAKVLAYDFINPWAKINEFRSTHPLTGKRLFWLDEISKEMGLETVFNIPKILKEVQVNQNRILLNFLSGAIFGFFPSIIIFLALLSLGISPVFGVSYSDILSFPPFWITLFGLSLIFQTIYRFPVFAQTEAKNILSLMEDPYSGPIKGKPIILKGTIVGRGLPGYFFSEDLMLQDKTGLIYLDYQSGIPFVGNFIFAWRKVREILGKEMEIKGWFFRSSFHYIVLDSLKYNFSQIKSYTKFWNLFFGILFLMIGIILSL
jgi:Zn-dependent protease with chaperone function